MKRKCLPGWAHCWCQRRPKITKSIKIIKNPYLKFCTKTKYLDLINSMKDLRDAKRTIAPLPPPTNWIPYKQISGKNCTSCLLFNIYLNIRLYLILSNLILQPTDEIPDQKSGGNRIYFSQHGFIFKAYFNMLLIKTLYSNLWFERWCELLSL